MTSRERRESSSANHPRFRDLVDAARPRTQRSRCSGDVPGDTQRNLRVKNVITDVRWKHILLPLWSVQYRFNKKTYTVLVNGQTGRVVGDAPYSWIKILLFILSIAAIVGLIVVVANAR